MVNFIVWIIAGAVLGWLVTKIEHGQGFWDLLINIVLGSIGAVMTGYLLTPMLHISTFSQASFSFLALLLSMGGAVLLLAAVYFFRRKRNVTAKVIEEKWTQVRSKIHVRWGKLTEEDIEQINGNHDTFIEKLQERYGCDEEQAEDELQSYLRAVV